MAARRTAVDRAATMAHRKGRAKPKHLGLDNGRRTKGQQEHMSASGGTRAIVAALGANLAIAASKFVAFAFSGSSSMLAEGVHSLADSGNQALLLIGGKKAQREATPSTPSATGRRRSSTLRWSSIVLFSVGGMFTISRATEKIKHPHQIEHWYWPVGVLVFAIIAEGFSFRTAIGVQRTAGRALLVAVHPPRQGPRAAGRPPGGLRRARRSGATPLGGVGLALLTTASGTASARSASASCSS